MGRCLHQRAHRQDARRSPSRTAVLPGLRPQLLWACHATANHVGRRLRRPRVDQHPHSAERQRSQFRAPMTWIPGFNEGTPCEDAANWAITLAPTTPPFTWEALFDDLREVQHRSEDPERIPCRLRRRQREPEDLKAARVAAREARAEQERRSAQTILIVKIRQWLKRLKDSVRFK